MNNLFNENYYNHKYLKYKSKYLCNKKNNLIGGYPTKEEIINEIFSLLKINSDRIIQSFLIGRIRVEPFSIPYTDKDQSIIENIRQKVDPLLTRQLVEWSVDTRARLDLHLTVTDTHIEVNLEIIPLFGCLILDDRDGRKRIIKTDDCMILEQKLNLSQDRHTYENLGNILRRHFTDNPSIVETKLVNIDEYNFIDVLNSKDLETLRLIDAFQKRQ
jgi:hypothetical protein